MATHQIRLQKVSNGMVRFVILVLSVQCLYAHNQNPLKDPYQSIRYEKAFDQEKVYKKHTKLLRMLGCATNILQRTKNSALITSATGSMSSKQHTQKSDSSAYKKELERYELDCLKQLNWHRKITLAEPALYAVAEIMLMAVGTGLAIKTLGVASMGGSFAGFAAIFDCLGLFKGVMGAGYNLISLPDNQLKDLEDYFAKNKCYIPSVLWPKIIKAFVNARQNEFSRETYTDFIEFSLGFTLYKPKRAIHGKNGMSLSHVEAEIEKRIDSFFSAYTKIHPDTIAQIKISVNKFINSLHESTASSDSMHVPRYIYLYGPGGIGKTHFVQTLSQWIEELMSESTHFENVVITSVDELEGTPDRPGIFLRILRNQLIENKRGSVIIIDEATWLNNESMMSAAKRVFNGDRYQLPTSYFGKGIDGAGIKLAMPPMLVFVASNEKLVDKPLESRFDTIEYPQPTKEALTAYAYECAQKSPVLSKKSLSLDAYTEKINAWIQTIKQEDGNFRYIAAHIETLLINS